ncbi:DUF4251 domain-containing protein [Psychroflexus aestuariivivens]|uniref:DUF4251 domain-containing protein n=1 Tax=Psychroflexus aestuariivivens TaxID=1795040 RepID=UPI001300A32D|nr:DUF4251 domain-containing protein [Psychroflexus aestuariivivens]
MQKLTNLVESKSFEIESNWARPSSTTSMNYIAQSGLLGNGSSVSRIDLIGNANYLKFEGDSVSADLPYYGERQSGGGYNSDQSITFEGEPKDLVIEKNEKKNFYNIEFSISNGTESFQVSIKIFPNLKTDIFVNSSHRLGINYGGRAEAIEEEIK